MNIQLVNGVRTNTAQLEMMVDWKTELLARSELRLRLFANNVAFSPSNPVSAYTEANYAGYAPITVTGINGPNLDQTQNCYMESIVGNFQCSGLGATNQIFGALLTGTLAGGTEATGTVVAAAGVITSATVTDAGSGYSFAPNVTVTGAGTGAVITAQVAGGVVTGLTVLDGGTGYTGTPTITIDPPEEVIAGSNLQNPISMALSTDACPVIMVLNLPVGS